MKQNRDVASSVEKSLFLERLENRETRVGVIGLGYVGLPLLLRFSEAGFPVLGFDIDASKVEALEEGRSYIRHIPDDGIRLAQERGMEVTSDFSRIVAVDALIICVPTPLDRHRSPDISYIVDTMAAILPHLRAGQLVSLESTTYPGTTEEEVLPRIESRGFVVGKDFFVVYSPEREDPGNASFSTKSIPKVCGGITENCLELGLGLYGAVIDQVVPTSSTKAAEMTKLLENIHRAVNIGLVNEMKIVADRMGIDIFEVIRAAGTKPFGFVPYFPGPGLGGHCIPIDPFYLAWKAKEFGVHTRFIELAGEVNSSMPVYVMDKIAFVLNNLGKSVRGAKVCVLGVAYKKNVDDMRESPSAHLVDLLIAAGAEVSYSDPYVPYLKSGALKEINLASVSLDQEVVASFDLMLIATDHDCFDYQMLGENAIAVVDTRGRLKADNQTIFYA